MSEISTELLGDFRERLESLQREIEELLGLTRRDSRPVDLELPIGRLSRADAMQMQSMAQLNRRQLGIRLEQVKGALAALDAGTFGSCRSCHGAVGLARLEVRPESPFCIDCQEMFEQEG